MTKRTLQEQRTLIPNDLRSPSELVPKRANQPQSAPLGAEPGVAGEPEQEAAYNEWALVGGLDLSPEQFRVLGYLINDLSVHRIQALTGIKAKEIQGWIRGDAHFALAFERLKENRAAFLKADTVGLQIKSMEVLAWYLTVNPEEMNPDSDRSRFSPRVQAVLFQEKRRVAALFVESLLARDRVTKFQIQHDIRNSVAEETLSQMAQLADKMQFNVVPRSALPEDVIEGEVVRGGDAEE